MKQSTCSPAKRHMRHGMRQYYQHTPRVNVVKQADNYLLQLAIPGLAKEDISIDVNGFQLTVSHTASENSNFDFINKGFDLNGFSRTFKLSQDIDVSKVHASFDAGVLTISLPLSDNAKPRTISIQ